MDRCRDQIAFFSSKFAVLKYMYGNQTLSFYLYVLIQRFLAKGAVTFSLENSHILRYKPICRKINNFHFPMIFGKKNIVHFCSERAKVPRIC